MKRACYATLPRFVGSRCDLRSGKLLTTLVFSLSGHTQQPSTPGRGGWRGALLSSPKVPLISQQSALKSSESRSQTHCSCLNSEVVFSYSRFISYFSSTLRCISWHSATVQRKDKKKKERVRGSTHESCIGLSRTWPRTRA